uniref:Reticulon-4-interacting protein 1 homolog, mitochondrial-like n=1 Tax=Saccoglossus kowalevskii TaxID=10224 RepID=A0ABM0GIN8_SACKO|nr:PREDICTED: reticulon-4-interacting protein 1 homolog, mitochondrial-like [Saccoglossus kowalevskii]
MSSYVITRVTWVLQLGSIRCFARSMTSLPTQMKAWQIHKYGDNRVLELQNTRVPVICKPNQVIVKVHAASINPVDIANRGGYGRQILSKMRSEGSGGDSFPITLGRDFSGVVMKTGQDAKKFKYGDEVWGISSFQNQGSHAEFVLVSTDEISKKPKCLNHIEASSMPYVALTTWAALITFGGLTKDTTLDKKVLVYAGSGEWVHLPSRMDFILDTLGGDTAEKRDLLKKWNNSTLVSIVTPLIKDTDQYGLPFGLASTGFSYMKNLFQGLRGGRTYRWAFCMPNAKALETISKLVEQQQIRPVIDEVFPFDKLPDAFEKLEKGGARGKTVINVIGKSN